MALVQCRRREVDCIEGLQVVGSHVLASAICDPHRNVNNGHMSFLRKEFIHEYRGRLAFRLVDRRENQVELAPVHPLKYLGNSLADVQGRRALLRVPSYKKARVDVNRCWSTTQCTTRLLVLPLLGTCPEAQE